MDRSERIRKDGLIEDPVEFYSTRGEYGYMPNFSRHKIILPHPFTGKMITYNDGETRFQAMKATNAGDHDLIVATGRPREAKQIGREIRLRPGWGSSYGDLCWYVMAELIVAKSMQHPQIQESLLATGERAIWEDSPKDNIWGIRKAADYTGKNLLGRAWMYSRHILRQGR